MFTMSSLPRSHPITDSTERIRPRYRHWLGSLLLALLVLPLAAQDDTVLRSGVGLRVGRFGIPNALLDLFIYEHPEIDGRTYAFEVHTFGDRGPRSAFTGVFSFEYSRMTGNGYWRVEQYDRRLLGAGEVEQFSLSATVLLNLFPSLAVHPYIGAGIGVGRISVWAEGTYQDEVGTTIHETYDEKRIVPVGHIPVGVVFLLGPRFEARIEGGFKNGFYAGGSLAFNF